MKKIMNSAALFVPELCHGLALAHAGLEYEPAHGLLLWRGTPGKVAVVSGGGSGHEPAHAGYVGEGMLTAAVCGDVFASPSQTQVYHAIRAADTGAGVLLVVKNYSGDMMNFKNAAALAREDGIDVEYVRVDDDIAVCDSLYTVGRRGVAGAVLVHKVAGAAALRGYALPRVKALAQRVIEGVRTIGFAETSCTVPAKGTPTFALADDEMEYGVGIHGEPGVRRERLPGADTLAARMVAELLAELDARAVPAQRVAVLVNGLGGTPLSELYVLYHCVRRELAARGVSAEFSLVGNYMTSLDMAGASLSLLTLDDELLELLRAPCDTPALRIPSPPVAVAYWPLSDGAPAADAAYEAECPAEWAALARDTVTLQNLMFLVDAMSVCIIRNEAAFCELDSHAGDGDFGMSLAKGFRRLKEQWAALAAKQTIGGFLGACSLVITEHCGGASGPVWGSALRAAGRFAGERTELSSAEFAELLLSAVRGIQATGERSFGRGAVVGDKTLMDALIPCAQAWEAGAQEGLPVRELFQRGAAAAVAGAKATEHLVARMGRAGTVGKRSLGHPDAGAHALGLIFTELSGLLR